MNNRNELIESEEKLNENKNNNYYYQYQDGSYYPNQTDPSNMQTPYQQYTFPTTGYTYPVAYNYQNYPTQTDTKKYMPTNDQTSTYNANTNYTQPNYLATSTYPQTQDLSYLQNQVYSTVPQTYLPTQYPTTNYTNQYLNNNPQHQNPNQNKRNFPNNNKTFNNNNNRNNNNKKGYGNNGGGTHGGGNRNIYPHQQNSNFQPNYNSNQANYQSPQQGLSFPPNNQVYQQSNQNHPNQNQNFQQQPPPYQQGNQSFHKRDPSNNNHNNYQNNNPSGGHNNYNNQKFHKNNNNKRPNQHHNNQHPHNNQHHNNRGHNNNRGHHHNNNNQHHNNKPYNRNNNRHHNNNNYHSREQNLPPGLQNTEVLLPPGQQTNEEPYQCENCEKSFKTLSAHQKHLESHVKCQEEGCDFSASEVKLKEHSLVHSEQVKNLQKMLATEEDIQKWREERRKNFPTREKIQEKLKNNPGLFNKTPENNNEGSNSFTNNSANPLSNTSSPSKRKRICIYWLKGHCYNGDQCTHSHDKDLAIQHLLEKDERESQNKKQRVNLNIPLLNKLVSSTKINEYYLLFNSLSHLFFLHNPHHLAPQSNPSGDTQDGESNPNQSNNQNHGNNNDQGGEENDGENDNNNQYHDEEDYDHNENDQDNDGDNDGDVDDDGDDHYNTNSDAEQKQMQGQNNNQLVFENQNNQTPFKSTFFRVTQNGK